MSQAKKEWPKLTTTSDAYHRIRYDRILSCCCWCRRRWCCCESNEIILDQVACHYQHLAVYCWAVYGLNCIRKQIVNKNIFFFSFGASNVRENRYDDDVMHHLRIMCVQSKKASILLFLGIKCMNIGKIVSTAAPSWYNYYVFLLKTLNGRLWNNTG